MTIVAASLIYYTHTSLLFSDYYFTLLCELSFALYGLTAVVVPKATSPQFFTDIVSQQHKHSIHTSTYEQICKTGGKISCQGGRRNEFGSALFCVISYEF